MDTLNKKYFNYIVSFSDLTLKTGITSKPFFRLQDFAQEATRHSMKVNAYEITSPSKSKKVALSIESSICKEFAHMSIDGHREWFKEDYLWIDNEIERKQYIENDHSLEYIIIVLNRTWDKHNNGEHARLMQRIYKIQDPYIEVKKIASELGARGSRIKARLATEISNKTVYSITDANLLALKKRADKAA